MLRIVTIGYHCPQDIIELLQSLEKYVHIESEVIIWDNGGCTDSIKKWLNENPNFPLPISTSGVNRNIGFAPAVNAASKIETGRSWQALLLLNPDATLASNFGEKEWLLLSNSQSISGLKVYNDLSMTSLQASARSFPGFMTAITGRKGFLTRLWPQNPWSKKYLSLAQTLAHTTDSHHKVDWVSGCALFCPRSVWEKLNGFDERFFLFVEDVDLCRRAKLQNISVNYVPIVSVVHSIGGTRKSNRWLADFYHHRGMFRYYTKWAGISLYLFAPFVLLGISLRYLSKRLLPQA